MKADKTKINRLLKTARGQLDGILKMVEEDKYCIDISNQIMASQAILRKAHNEIIRAHLDGCVVSAFESGNVDEKNAKIDEIISILDKLSK